MGWGATVREIDHLATLFDEIVHLAPLYSGSPPGSALSYEATNVRVRPVTPAGGTSIFSKVGVLSGYRPGPPRSAEKHARLTSSMFVARRTSVFSPW